MINLYIEAKENEKGVKEAMIWQTEVYIEAGEDDKGPHRGKRGK